jgi:hypothetical protein
MNSRTPLWYIKHDWVDCVDVSPTTTIYLRKKDSNAILTMWWFLSGKRIDE